MAAPDQVFLLESVGCNLTDDQRANSNRSTHQTVKNLFQRIGLIFVVLVVLLITLGVFFVWNKNRRVAAKIQELREAGKPVSVADLGELPSLRGDSSSILQELAAPLQSLEQAMAKAQSSGDEQQDREMRVAIFRAFESEQPGLIELLRGEAEEPGTCSKLFYDDPVGKFNQSLLDQIAAYRPLTRALTYHAEAELTDGNTDEVLRDAIAILNWSEKISHEPCMVSNLTFVAVRSSGIQLAADCMYRGDATKEVREQLLDTLRQHDPVAAWSRMIDSERALSLTMFGEMPTPLRLMQAVNGGTEEYLELFDDFDALGKKPSGIDTSSTPTGGLVFGVYGSLNTVLGANRRVQALTNAVLILAAWQDQGSDPSATIAGLRLPVAAVLDPCDGSTMKLIMTTAGPIIYSAGEDGLDNGGEIAERDVGIAPK